MLNIYRRHSLTKHSIFPTAWVWWGMQGGMEGKGFVWLYSTRKKLCKYVSTAYTVIYKYVIHVVHIHIYVMDRDNLNSDMDK